MKKINQDQQIKPSDVYDDTVSSGATMESGATNLEDDLNAIRSQLKSVVGTTNWYDSYPGATDSAAIHDNVSGEVSVLTLKATLVGADVILIEDSAAANAKKSATISGIPHNSLSGYEANRHIDWTAASAGTIHATNYSSTDSNAVHVGVDAEIYWISTKATPVSGDWLLIEDSQSTFPKKKISVGSIPHDSLSGYEANRHIDWTVASAGTIHATNYSSVDSTAIHKATAGELSVMTAKATPVSADILLIEDSAAANAKKRITISAIPHDSLSGYSANRHIDWTASSAGTIHTTNYTDAIRKSVSGEVAALTLKATLVGADVILVEDSAAANAKKRTTVAGIPHNSLSGYEVNRHIDWTAASAGTIHATNYSSVDSTAIHKATAGELSVMTAKATPVSADILLIEDSAAANAKKKITISAIPHDSLSGYSANRHIDWTAASAGTIHATNYTAVDANAIHKNTSAEISTVTAKATPVGADLLLIEDSAATNAKKKITISTIPHNSLSGYEANRHIDWTAASAGTIHATNYTPIDTTAIHKATSGEIAALTLKATLVGTDVILIEDSAAANAKKRTTVAGIPHNSLSGYEANRHIDWTAASAGTIHATNYSVSTPTLQSTWNVNGTATVDIGPSDINLKIRDNNKFTVQEPAGVTDILRVSAAAAGDKVEINAANFNVTSTNTIDFNTMLKVSSATSFPATLSTQLLDFTNGSEATIRSGGDLGFIDSYKTASTVTTKLKVAGSTTEWETFYGKFGSSSLVDSIIKAQGWTTVKLASDFSNSTTTASTVTGWSFTPAADKTYEYEVMSLCTTTATTTGIQLGVSGMAGTITHGAIIRSPLTQTTSTERHAYGTSAANSTSTGTPATVPQLITAKGMIISGATPSGNCNLTLRSEIAASNVTVKAGSFFRWREIV